MPVRDFRVAGPTRISDTGQIRVHALAAVDLEFCNAS